MKKSILFFGLLVGLLLASCGQVENSLSSGYTSANSSQDISSSNTSSEEINNDDILFDLGENSTEEKHVDPREATEGDFELISGTNKITLKNNEKLYYGAFDAKGNSCIKLGTGRAIGKFSFTVTNDINSVVFKVAKYKYYGSVISINDTKYTLSKNSNDGEYEEITIDTTTNKIIIFETTQDGKYESKDYETNQLIEKTNPRCMINSITLKKKYNK